MSIELTLANQAATPGQDDQRVEADFVTRHIQQGFSDDVMRLLAASDELISGFFGLDD